LLLAKIITAITLGADKIQKLTFKSAIIAPNSHKNPMQHSQQGMSGPVGKNPWPSLSLFFAFPFSPKKQ
jgi:hypothetical protein